MRPLTFLWAVLAVTPFTSVTAQYSVQVRPGDRVRVTHQCSNSVRQTNGKTGTGCRGGGAS